MMYWQRSLESVPLQRSLEFVPLAVGSNFLSVHGSMKYMSCKRIYVAVAVFKWATLLNRKMGHPVEPKNVHSVLLRCGYVIHLASRLRSAACTSALLASGLSCRDK